MGALLTAFLADRFWLERVLTYTAAFGALCLLSIGLLNPWFWGLSAMICGAGVGIGGCQAGLNALSGQIYPPTIRSTGAGCALGLGRVGAVAGPLLGGVLLVLGLRAQGIFVAAAISASAVALLIAILGRLRRGWCGGPRAQPPNATRCIGNSPS